MPELLLEKPDSCVFWSAYDPLDLASDSIDPLGFMAGYVALADRFFASRRVPPPATIGCRGVHVRLGQSGKSSGGRWLACRRDSTSDWTG